MKSAVLPTIITLMAVLPTMAHATKQPPPPPAQEAPPTTVANGGYADSYSQSASSSTSNSSSYSVSENVASADNAGNSLSVTSIDTRQAPSIAQGGLYIGECGASGNAGGSRSSGSAFLGFAYTPKDCKYLLAARAYQSLGMVDAACEMIQQVSVVKAYWATQEGGAPSCKVTPAPEPVKAIAVPEPSCPAEKTCYTKAEIDQRDRKIIETATRK